MLNILLKKAEVEGRILEFKISNLGQSQTLSQFANDTTIYIEVPNVETIRNLIDNLELFKDITAIEINWQESHAF